MKSNFEALKDMDINELAHFFAYDSGLYTIADDWFYGNYCLKCDKICKVSEDYGGREVEFAPCEEEVGGICPFFPNDRIDTEFMMKTWLRAPFKGRV